MILLSLFKELFTITFEFFAGYLTDLVMGLIFPQSPEE